MQKIVPAKRKGVILFGAISIIVLVQVGWWTAVFLSQVHQIEKLKKELNIATLEVIQTESFHQRLMFLSESLTFMILTCLGLWLLYRALRSEERARESERSFIEMITHESKTPLTSLKLRLEHLIEKPEAQSFIRDLKVANEEVRRLCTVFEKTLDLNRLERTGFFFEEIALSEVVREVLRRLEPWFRDRNAQVKTELEEEILVQGDAGGLSNSLQSLFENAVIYNSNPTKEIAISVFRRKESAVLHVSDNGPGILRADRERIFDRFYRGDNSKGVSGTGLGLFIAKTVIEAHRGAIRLLDIPTLGSRFEIELPICAQQT